MTLDILSMDLHELRTLMAELGQPTYRAEQIFEWLHRRGAAFFDEMINLPKNLREVLAESCHITPCREVKKQLSKDGTVKYLFALGEDEMRIESVLMEYKHGYSVCVSTQAGCRMGCAFCASTAGGLVRNLTAGEICAQVYRMPERVSSIVLMGCGEPLDNYEAVMRFIELITHPKGANIGARHITLSTCGLVSQMRDLAEKKLQINLAVSLHGPSDEVRKQFMPVASRYPLGELLDACRYYIKQTNRRITFEYALAAGINDTPIHARELAHLLRGLLCHVNLIPINAKPASGKSSRGFMLTFSPTPRRETEAFAALLKQHNIPVTIRRSLGNDIAAACGQLRVKHRN
jgi:23S rRNA (adenine2503-C2)-methyltransferase